VILIAGGTGFIGPKVVHALRAEDHPVRVLARKPERHHQLRAWGCEVVQGDVTDAASLRRAVDGCETVIDLVAIISGKPEDFQRVMIQGTRNLLGAAKKARVARFILMSALGVSERTKDLTPYYHAKWDEEQAVQASGLDYTIFRPSFIFGADGGSLPIYIRQVRWSPVVTVIGDGNRRLQPIWVEDIAAFFTKALSTAGAVNRTFEVAGPDVVTWDELYERIRRVLGKRRPTIHMPYGLVRAGAAVVEKLPLDFPLSRDAVTMLEFEDNVTDIGPALETFEIRPITLDEQLRRAVAA
jgi:NADH dehydrogenase